MKLSSTSILFFSLLVLLLILVSCGPDPECEINSDCPSRGACFESYCEEEVCHVDIIKACCGNNICESNAGENVCSCNKDCSTNLTSSGKCEGKIQVENPRRRGSFVDAQYSSYSCDDNNECVVSVNPKDVASSSFVTNTRGHIQFQAVTTINNPLLLGQDSLNLRVSITDYDDAYAKLPVTITSVQVMSGNQLMGEYSTPATLSTVGESVELIVPLNAALATLEENKRVEAVVNYEYYSYDRDKELYVERSSFTTSNVQVVFIDPTKVEV